MWIPKDAAQVETAATAGAIEESDSFDAKASLPQSKKNSDIAIDVAAMSTDGGVLLYGVAEDEHERPTVLMPFALAGQADRIGQVVATCIAEVPFIEFRELPTPGDPAVGYLVVVIPQSARAPHQVTVGGDHRYYGRGAKANRRLPEAEVARLYRRREDWDVDARDLLSTCVASAPAQPNPRHAYLHGFVRPVAPDPDIWRKAAEGAGGPNALRDQIQTAARVDRPGRGTPFREYTSWQQHGADEWRLLSNREDLEANPDFLPHYAQAGMNVDGHGDFFTATIGGRHEQTGSDPGGALYLYEHDLAGSLAAFVRSMSTIYVAAQYFGNVDLGIAATGLAGGVSVRSLQAGGRFTPYAKDTYIRTARVTAAELNDAEAITMKLVGSLVQATSMRENFNPFVDA